MSVYTNRGNNITRSPAVTSASTTLTVSGLRGNADRGYRLVMWFKNAGADAALYLRPNGVITNLAYENTALAEDPATLGIWVANMRANSVAYVTVDFWSKTGGNRICHFTGGTKSLVTPFAWSRQQGSGWWTDTTTELTYIDIVSNVAASIDIGSTIEAYPLGSLF